MKWFRYYRRQVFWTLWGSFCLRFVRNCHLFKDKIDQGNIGIKMGFIWEERRNVEINRIRKRREKIDKHLSKTKSDCI